MSRSRPEEHISNPASPFYEWHGEKGVVKFYDKATENTIEIGDDFTFILLDELKTIKGWSDSAESGIWANEVKDLTKQPLVVRTKHGIIATGFYAAIKDRVVALGGKFVANLYIAYKSNGGLKLGAIQFSGAALHDWADFRNANRANVYSKAVRIKGSKDGKKGSVKFKTPVFHLIELSEASNAAAVELDKTLQAYLEKYLAKNTAEQASIPHDAPEGEQQEEPQREPDEEPPQAPPAGKPDTGMAPDNIPF